MTTKKTVPLSQIVDYATNEVNPSPNIKSFSTLAKIVRTLPDAKIAIRIQLTNKIKSYCNGFLPKKEMYYCLCLADFLVKQCPEFRPQMMNSDFMVLFERASEISKVRKTSKKPSLVTEKSMKIVQSWGQMFPDDLYEYSQMYDKYISKGVIFPLLDFDDPEDVAAIETLTTNKVVEETIEEKMKRSASEINECSELIHETLKKVTNVSLQAHSINALYKRAVEINSKFNILFVEFMQKSTDTSLLQKYSEIENVFTSNIAKLISFINNPQESLIYRTFTTGHLEEEDDDDNTTLKNSVNAQRKKRIILSPVNSNTISDTDRTPKESSQSTRRGSNQLLPPPSSTGIPIRQTPQSVIQIHQNKTDTEPTEHVIVHRIGKLKKRSFTQTEFNHDYNELKD
ncbi:hypothetical protein ENUP19_0061G0065 [Entamoeba nuttalli]|uniref:VHS domain-containing protein n=2 Tax=Entamoeba nuttalli TaxID=412467 RepID=K2G553_ENTNP|nr:hypothetical protein ENU1_196490 [Entamoeba nuttalli P19]EKE37466.1 hypothetical protein ENU1_196490 [Entamoeba nuttalli P19]|eukprot:XP_008860191.1 hypothetical protein ENU1_196490 [Entamoeba nuttalli P19]